MENLWVSVKDTPNAVLPDNRITDMRYYFSDVNALIPLYKTPQSRLLQPSPT